MRAALPVLAAMIGTINMSNPRRECYLASPDLLTRRRWGIALAILSALLVNCTGEGGGVQKKESEHEVAMRENVQTLTEINNAFAAITAPEHAESVADVVGELATKLVAIKRHAVTLEDPSEEVSQRIEARWGVELAERMETFDWHVKRFARDAKIGLALGGAWHRVMETHAFLTGK